MLINFPFRPLQITRRNAFAKAMAGIEAAERLMPEGRVKLNCVVMRGINDDELVQFVELTAERVNW